MIGYLNQIYETYKLKKFCKKIRINSVVLKNNQKYLRNGDEQINIFLTTLEEFLLNMGCLYPSNESGSTLEIEFLTDGMRSVFTNYYPKNKLIGINYAFRVNTNINVRHTAYNIYVSGTRNFKKLRTLLLRSMTKSFYKMSVQIAEQEKNVFISEIEKLEDSIEANFSHPIQPKPGSWISK